MNDSENTQGVLAPLSYPRFAQTVSFMRAPFAETDIDVPAAWPVVSDPSSTKSVW
mgnify:CR=1 FL=1